MFRLQYFFVLIYLHFSQSSSLFNNLQLNINSNNAENYGTDSSKHFPPDLPTPELIMRRGYPLEIHEVITEDNYILTMHRIPYGKLSPEGHGSKYPVIVVHGGAQSSSDWLLNFHENKCLPFLLANAGYDVWLGNIRGNMYSNRHLNLTHEQTAFWDFSIDELAKYDVPNTIDYILEKTKKQRVHYIGFSLGNAMFFMAMANKPEYNRKIGIHVAYGPSVFFGTFPDQSRLLSYFAHKPFRMLQNLSGGFPVPPPGITFLVTQFLSKFCNPKVDFLGLCRQIMFLIVGFGPDQISQEQTPILLGHLLMPTSLKILVHLMQMQNSGSFSHYDNGERKNMEMYGQPAAPLYDLSRVTCPVSICFGKGDILANEKGARKLAEALPNMVDYYKVPFERFTHIDFTYGSSANHFVYNHTMKMLDRFSG